MKYTTILFDLDGTLTDPAVGITGGVAHALDYFGNKYDSRKQLEEFIGPPLREHFMEFCGVDREKGEEYVAKYREYYATVGIYENKVYNGTEDMLKALKGAGKKIVLATSKPEKFAGIILEHFGLMQYFDFVAGALMSNSRTKKDEVIAYALENIGEYDKNSIIMVGDRMHDVEGAEKFGIDTIGVTFGYGTYEELYDSGAKIIVDTVEELKAELLK
ncbi:MAG: HAD family hydrolase [Ruminococcaceae bacterium]|nr:HAD family hydrolase [Oscillospiraceae bacterium]